MAEKSLDLNGNNPFEREMKPFTIADMIQGTAKKCAELSHHPRMTRIFSNCENGQRPKFGQNTLRAIRACAQFQNVRTISIKTRAMMIGPYKKHLLRYLPPFIQIVRELKTSF